MRNLSTKIIKNGFYKFFAFGSEGVNTMVGLQDNVAIQIQNKVNPFLLSCHCVTHRTTILTLHATKIPAYEVIYCKWTRCLI